MNFPYATPLEWAWVAVALVALGYALRNLRQAIRNWRYQRTAPDDLPDWTPDPDLVHLARGQVRGKAVLLIVISFYVFIGGRSLFYPPPVGATWDTQLAGLYAIATLLVLTGWAAYTNRDEARLRARYAARQETPEEPPVTEDVPTQHLEEIH